MEVFVGTSGWAYSWNEGGNLKWFAENSKLNAIELNMSFYRFPFPNVIKGWSKIGENLRWSIKVNRLITHVNKFNEKASDLWKRFFELFESIDKLVDFYLFQLPPSFTPKSIKRLEKFIKLTKLKNRFAIECRNEEWFCKKYVKWATDLGITLVSVDAPKFSREVYNTNGIVYERMHGRDAWYSHNYSDKELSEVAEKILKTKPKKVYVFFNNNHAMLENARRMMKILK